GDLRRLVGLGVARVRAVAEVVVVLALVPQDLNRAGHRGDPAPGVLELLLGAEVLCGLLRLALGLLGRLGPGVALAVPLGRVTLELDRRGGVAVRAQDRPEPLVPVGAVDGLLFAEP